MFMHHSCAPQWGPNALGSLPSILFLLGCIKINTVKPAMPKRPHIVFMLVDDLGWNDVSFHGSKQIPTPNVDAIARDGIILNQYYVQHICSPSRGCLMTGKYAIRIGFQHDVIIASSPWGLPLSEKILPQYLKDLNYSTHAVGKWHLGFFKEEYLPTRRGFDSFFGYYAGLEDYFTHVSKTEDMEGLDLHENERPVWNYNGTYGSDLFTMKAKKIILEHDSIKPLFLYFAQQAPHSGNFQNPLQAPDRYVKPMVGIKDAKRKIFAGMVSSMDHSVGEIFEALEVSGMLNDTIFIFSTDNGGAPQAEIDGTSGSNWPLKGRKYTLWEGGIRGVSFIWSPFLRYRSRIHNKLMHITDWLPTILSAVGGQKALKVLPKNIDGVDQWPSIAYGLPSPRTEILLNIDDIEQVEGIRRGKYKLVKGTYFNGSYDKWYDKEGKSTKTSRSLQTHSMEKLYRKNYLRFLKRSKAAAVLWYNYNKDPNLVLSCFSTECEDLLEVKCKQSLNLRDSCNAQKEPCLFDVIRDPCEYDNIAKELPMVTRELEEAIEKFRAVTIPAKNLPIDPVANPKYHGNVWVPWK